MRLIPSSFLMVFLSLVTSTSTIANESNTNYCAVSTGKTGTLDTARALYQSTCANYTLVDCDPIDGGGWECSSDVIGTNSPASVNEGPGIEQNTSEYATRDTTTTDTESLSKSDATPTPTTSAVPTSEPEHAGDSGECYAVATGLNQSKIAFTQKCAKYQRNDCDPLGSNRWVCSSANVTRTEPYLEAIVSSPTVTADTPEPAPRQVQTNAKIGRLASNDLLVLHYDNCPDKDDGHAIPAGLSVVEKYDINNVLAVNGTCGNSIRNKFNHTSNAVMEASWGTEYLDADRLRSSAVLKASTRWAATLSNGANVWVAEGGQSDFTADVVRQIETRYSNFDLMRIHVIQHSTGSTAYNEKFTDSSNLSYLKNKTSYQAIANGNVGGNGTADLNQQSFYFVSTARASRFSAEWNAGFEYLPPDCSVRTENCKLDFSDTVELLYIVDDKSTQNVNDFANKYLN